MQEEGYVAKLLYPEGAKDVKLGEPVAVISFDLKDVPAFEDWIPGGAPVAVEKVVKQEISQPKSTP